MRAKKVLVIVMTLIACLAVGSATVATAKKATKKKISTTITVTVTATPANPNAPYTPASAAASGKVSAEGPSGCKKGRTVTIFRDGAPAKAVVTGPKGEYAVTIAGVSSGGYQARVAKRVINRKKKHKKFVCLAAATGVVVIP
jgi:hypothetical protein